MRDTAAAPGRTAHEARAHEDRDLQSMVSDALRRLAETTGSARACAWSERPDGELYVLAANFRDETSPTKPDRETMAALAPVFEAGHAVDLGTEGKQLARLMADHGMSSGVPLVSSHGERIAVLLLGGTDDPPGRVRPRTLAALMSTAERLRLPATAASARARLTALDAEVCRLDRLSVLGDLLSEVAHEIRNPLVSMKTFLHLLPQRHNDEEFTGEFREVVLEELGRMERLLDTLLEHARPAVNLTGGGERTETSDLACVFESLVRLLEQRANEREVELVSQIEGATDQIAIGEDGLRQILLNLVLNALEASPASSTVALHASSTPERIAFSVEDCGPGVCEVSRDRLFEPFFSTRDDRAGGLGLAITKKLVEAAGGTIRVEDAASGGARFCVQLPRRSS
ncbi:MAG: HAMP domain-containing histidine kinase [bacterium]|nr:HAMP domain-containing histidine kinase [bacterium]